MQKGLKTARTRSWPRPKMAQNRPKMAQIDPKPDPKPGPILGFLGFRPTGMHILGKMHGLASPQNCAKGWGAPTGRPTIRGLRRSVWWLARQNAARDLLCRGLVFKGRPCEMVSSFRAFLNIFARAKLFKKALKLETISQEVISPN